MKNRRSLVSAGAFLAVFAGTACAGTVSVTFGSLASPPGTYFGSGNSNTDWTVSTDSVSGLELGLGALIRYESPVAPVAPLSTEDADYYVPAGASTSPYAQAGSSAWGFDYSVNTQAGGVGTADVSDYTYSLSITDLTVGATFTGGEFDPSQLPDNATYGQPGPITGFQNAEALYFGTASGPPQAGYDINATDTYQITLTATPTAVGGTAESVSIDVIAVTPEPQTWLLIGSGLLCVIAVRRRSIQQRA